MGDPQLDVEIQKDGVTAKLTEPFRVKVKGYEITVPAGFLTNFASVPKLFWNVISPWGEHSRAAVVHDWLYQSGITEKDVADLIFKALMIRYGVPAWQAEVMYQAVKWFGGRAWRACRKRQENLPVNVGGPWREVSK
ncbi:MAG TPA: DUF1353 domain-containing protein [Candidatus Sumerlaeota bacterium]|nr:DUF1353 domain-containing protein [Candidatus Sumerlaeota bacterium]